MAERIHILVSLAEKERFRRVAEREGKSLSEWLRLAAEDRAAEADERRELNDAAALEAFFVECDERERGVEPDWAAHLDVMNRSRQSGAAPT